MDHLSILKQNPGCECHGLRWHLTSVLAKAKMHPSPIFVMPLKCTPFCRSSVPIHHQPKKWMPHVQTYQTFKSNNTTLNNISLRTLIKVDISSFHGQSKIPVLPQRSTTSLTIVNNHTKFAKYTSTIPNDPRNVTPQVEPQKFQIDPYMKLSRFDRPIGTWLLLWPCYWSIAMGMYESDHAIWT